MPAQRKPQSVRARRNARQRRIKAWKRRLLVVAAAVVVVLLAHWWWTASQTREANAFAGGHVVRVTGPDLNVREYGSGSRDGAIVLLPGYTTSIEFWEAVAPQLAESHYVVAIDPVGHGGSESPTGAGAYSADGQAGSVARVLRAMGLSHVTVIGHSMGGGIATRLAETEPGLVSRVALVDSYSVADGARLTRLRDLACLPAIGPALDRFRGLRTFSSSGLKSAFAEDFDVPEMAYRSLERMTWQAFCNAAGLIGDLNEEMPLPERLVDTGKPTIAVYGAKDVLTPTAENVAAYRAAGITVHVIETSGHSPHVETPAELVRILRAFLD